MLIDKIALIALKEGKILCAKSKGKTKFYIPGGKREKGESDHETLTREIKEELDVNLLPESLTLTGVFEAPADGKPQGTIVKMTCYYGDYEGNPRASSEIEEIRWLSYSDIPLVSRVDTDIFEFLKNKEELT